MHKLDLPIDLKEAAAVRRRRHLEEQRKCRIFNAKQRLIGIDVNALEHQIHDKEERDGLEKQRDLAFDLEIARNSKLTLLLQQRQQHDLRQLNQSLNEFRYLHQQPSSRKEWDLNDPDRLKKDLPARLCDDDPRCGLASMQKFIGEDLNHKARLKHQQEQYRNWMLLQKKEKEEAEVYKKEANRLFDLKRTELDLRALDLQRAEEKCKKAISIATENFNKALAREMADRKWVKEQQETEDKITEIVHHITGDILTENPDVSVSGFGSHRVIPDRWRGMTTDQKAKIFETQKQQLEENKVLQKQQKLEDDEWNRQSMINNKAAVLLTRQQERERRELDKKLMEENMKLARIQKDHEDYLNKDLYTNNPTAAYFLQFNTTTR